MNSILKYRVPDPDQYYQDVWESNILTNFNNMYAKITDIMEMILRDNV